MINKIIKGESIEELKKIKSKSVDVIFSDPPYFMQTEGELKRHNGDKFAGVDDDWDKFSSYEEYDSFTKKWLSECKRILKDDGSIWVIGTYHNLFRLGYIMQDLNFWILNDIVWEKSNPTPNFLGTKFVNAQETLIWATKSKKSKFTFNYKTMKELNGGKQMKSVWNFPISSGAERLKGLDGKKLLNTQKPIKLLEYIILSSTKKNDLILDPFFGTGTTGAAAKSLGRNYIGIEREEKYIKASKIRINDQGPNKNYNEIIINSLLDVKLKRVPMENLIKEGFIRTKKLYSPDKIRNVELKKNGKVFDGKEELSIHRMAGKFQDKENFNGWKYWYTKDGKLFISIDAIRERYRNEQEKN